MSKIKAKDVTLNLGNAIAGLKECQITLSTVTEDARIRGSKRLRRFVRVDWTASATAEVGHESGTALTRGDLEAAVKSGTRKNLTFSIGTGSALTGQCMIQSMSEKAPVDGRMTYDLSLKGVGPISIS